MYRRRPLQKAGPDTEKPTGRDGALAISSICQPGRTIWSPTKAPGSLAVAGRANGRSKINRSQVAGDIIHRDEPPSHSGLFAFLQLFFIFIV